MFSIVVKDKFCFSLIACCPTLNVLLQNNVKDKQGKCEGNYTFHGFSNGMDYWHGCINLGKRFRDLKFLNVPFSKLLHRNCG